MMQELEEDPGIALGGEADIPEAVAREGADGLTLRREKEGVLRTFIDTTNVGDSKEIGASARG